MPAGTNTARRIPCKSKSLASLPHTCPAAMLPTRSSPTRPTSRLATSLSVSSCTAEACGTPGSTVTSASLDEVRSLFSCHLPVHCYTYARLMHSACTPARPAVVTKDDDGNLEAELVKIDRPLMVRPSRHLSHAVLACMWLTSNNDCFWGGCLVLHTANPYAGNPSQPRGEQEGLSVQHGNPARTHPGMQTQQCCIGNGTLH